MNFFLPNNKWNYLLSGLCLALPLETAWATAPQSAPPAQQKADPCQPKGSYHYFHSEMSTLTKACSISMNSFDSWKTGYQAELAKLSQLSTQYQKEYARVKQSKGASVAEQAANNATIATIGGNIEAEKNSTLGLCDNQQATLAAARSDIEKVQLSCQGNSTGAMQACTQEQQAANSYRENLAKFIDDASEIINDGKAKVQSALGNYSLGDGKSAPNLQAYAESAKSSAEDTASKMKDFNSSDTKNITKADDKVAWGWKEKGSLGDGAAEKAKTDLQLREEYNRYNIKTQSNGDDAKSYEEWKKDRLKNQKQILGSSFDGNLNMADASSSASATGQYDDVAKAALGEEGNSPYTPDNTYAANNTATKSDAIEITPETRKAYSKQLMVNCMNAGRSDCVDYVNKKLNKDMPFSGFDQMALDRKDPELQKQNAELIKKTASDKAAAEKAAKLNAFCNKNSYSTIEMEAYLKVCQ